VKFGLNVPRPRHRIVPSSGGQGDKEAQLLARHRVADGGEVAINPAVRAGYLSRPERLWPEGADADRARSAARSAVADRRAAVAVERTPLQRYPDPVVLDRLGAPVRAPEERERHDALRGDQGRISVRRIVWRVQGGDVDRPPLVEELHRRMPLQTAGNVRRRRPDREIQDGRPCRRFDRANRPQIVGSARWCSGRRFMVWCCGDRDLGNVGVRSVKWRPGHDPGRRRRRGDGSLVWRGLTVICAWVP
jgi:hypothetical protein